MPKKIPFRVVYCSGYEDDFPPKDLEVHSPFIKGWRSPRYCLYPQEIIIRTEQPVRFRKIQLLSHQYMIPTKIELYVGQSPSSSHLSVVDHAHFTRLGYISLSDNEQTGFRSRELKSVNVDCTGQYIKLLLHQNHINRLNLFNQVGLIALNFIADPFHAHDEEVGVVQSLPSHVTHYIGSQNKESLSDVHTQLPSYRHSKQAPVTDPVLLGTINKPSHISAMDDLAFAIAQDPQTAVIIRRLDTRKTQAVKEERFDFAKHLKQVIDELQKIGEFLCRYEIEKKRAIEREDYDTAKEKKTQADKIRRQVFDKLDVQGLLDAGHQQSKKKRTHHHSNERGHPIVKRSPFEMNSATNIPPSEPSVPQTNLSPGHASTILPPIVSSSSSSAPVPPPPAAAAINRRDQDDRPLPALVNKSNQQSFSEQGELDKQEVTDEKPEHLTEKQLNEVPIAVEVFGMENVELVYAKQYPLREKGLQLIRQTMDSTETASRKEVATMVKATCQILKKALKDKVHTLFTQSLNLLKYLVGPYSQQHRLTKPELTFIIEKVFPTLLARTGDMSPRKHLAAMNVIMELAQHSQIKQLSIVGPLLVEPFKPPNAPWRLAKSRIELLERFIHDPGLNSSGVTIKKLMEFVSLCLQHSNGEVRDTAVKLTFDLYRMHGQDIRHLLPVEDDDVSRKKTLWKTVFEGFDRIDGVPTQKEREAAKANLQRAKNEEIQKLQEQVNMLRNLTSKGETVTEDKLEMILKPDTSGTQKQADENSPSDERTLDMTCLFCSEKRSDLVGSGMESHYLNECPMLQTCTHCSHVIEISGLTKHWLTDCEARNNFKECTRCKEAIHSSSYQGHIKANSCRPAAKEGGNTSRCPLCHDDIQGGEEGWWSHLIGPGPRTCPKNRDKQGRRGQAAGTRSKPTGRGILRAVPKGTAGKKLIKK